MAEWVNTEARSSRTTSKRTWSSRSSTTTLQEREKLDKQPVDFLFGGDTHVLALDTEAAISYAQSWEYGKTALDFSYNKSTGEFSINSVAQHDATSLVSASSGRMQRRRRCEEGG